ncbi:ribbon-helix-helix protein, CopG family [Tautonia sp. JC769]|uniref:CopG family ribbon-helix-helix protein n=1 Tax=Tautonia sp. JC769 TaxID=3232135 RepID=UPI003458CA5F
MDKVNVTVRMDKEKVDMLDELAKSDDRDRSYLIKQAVDSYIRMRKWQIDDIKHAVAEADAGDFVPDDEMEKLYAKWSQ